MLGGFVLVVDDNPETLNLLAHALEAEGIQVRTATSVFRALEALHDGSPRPSMIITDLLMPRTTGWDFLKHVRGEQTLQTLPVLVVTGAEPGESAALADVVMQKPFDPLQVVDTVRQMLAGRAAH